MAATLRPETMYGQTNCFVLPRGKYIAIETKHGEIFVCSEHSARNMAWQKFTAKEGVFEALCEIEGWDLLGRSLRAPNAKYYAVHVLPLTTIKMDKGTGIVMAGVEVEELELTVKLYAKMACEDQAAVLKFTEDLQTLLAALVKVGQELLDSKDKHINPPATESDYVDNLAARFKDLILKSKCSSLKDADRMYVSLTTYNHELEGEQADLHEWVLLSDADMLQRKDKHELVWISETQLVHYIITMHFQETIMATRACRLSYLCVWTLHSNFCGQKHFSRANLKSTIMVITKSTIFDMQSQSTIFIITKCTNMREPPDL